jgi:hypothetical protein
LLLKPARLLLPFYISAAILKPGNRGPKAGTSHPAVY